MKSLGYHDKMARTVNKHTYQHKTRKTPRRNRHSDKN